MTMRWGAKFASVILMLGYLSLAATASSSAATTKTVTIAAATPQVGNCWFFGEATQPNDEWTPFAAWVYKNIPPFDLKRGDTLAFDSGVQNDFDIQVDIALAATTTNGGDANAGPFTTI